jgi:hypothetical protein
MVIAMTMAMLDVVKIPAPSAFAAVQWCAACDVRLTGLVD